MECPICGTQPIPTQPHGNCIQYSCPRCGPWVLFENLGEKPPFRLGDVLGAWDFPATHRRSRLSHIVRRQQRTGGQPVGVQVHRLAEWNLDEPLPTPAEQLDRLILWVAEHQPSYAQRANLSPLEIAAWVGAPIVKSRPGAGVDWLIPIARQRRLLEELLPGDGGEVRLTLEGWARYEELHRVGSRSRRAFMAMQFNDPEVEDVVRSVFQPAVARAGFVLETLQDGQGAGLIDDQLRVALRTSRFVIADLTRGNQGAYWEAGFAEGLGRPVIYTCRKAEFDHKKKRPHFDTNHLLTVVWTPDDLSTAAEKLTATIRATLPEEAKMTD